MARTPNDKNVSPTAPSEPTGGSVPPPGGGVLDPIIPEPDSDTEFNNNNVLELDTDLGPRRDPLTIVDLRDRQILILRQDNENIRRRGENLRTQSRAAVRRLQEGHEKKDATITKLRGFLNNEQGRFRNLKTSHNATLHAAEIEFRARLEAAKYDSRGDRQLALHKETARQAKGSVKELEREIARLTKMDSANSKKLDSTSNELEEVGKQNRRFKEDHKDLTKKLKVAEKSVQANLELKYQHERKKAELGVEKERLALKRARESRRKASATLDKQQQNKKDLIEEKKRAAISLTVAREEHKTKKQKSRVDQAAERINTANMMHMATNGRFPTPNEATAAAAAAATAAILAGGRTSTIAAAASTGNISEVSTFLFRFYFYFF